MCPAGGQERASQLSHFISCFEATLGEDKACVGLTTQKLVMTLKAAVWVERGCGSQMGYRMEGVSAGSLGGDISLKESRQNGTQN